jgi:uncharacterized protein
MKDRTITELMELAESGDLNAQRELGVRFRDGRGVSKSLAEAEKWFRKAAETNDAWSQYCLGHLAHKGKDVVEAESWWRKAAVSGEPTAQYALAFSCGDLLSVDEKQKWLRKSANSGYPEAQKFLGFLTFWGCAIDRDRVAGMKWMILGAEGTIKSVWASKLQIKMMKLFMTRDEVFRAELSVRQWKEERARPSVVQF